MKFIAIIMVMILIIFIDVKLGEDIYDGKFINAGINIFLQLIVIYLLV